MRGLGPAALAIIGAATLLLACGLTARGVAEGATIGEASPSPSPESTSNAAASIDGGGDAGKVCAPSLPSTTASCPDVCTDCTGGTCNIACAEEECTGKSIDCPPGMACALTCTGEEACAGAQIHCNATHPCSVACNGEESCHAAEVHCGTGACAIACGTGAKACIDTRLLCSTGACTATCTGGSAPSLVAPATSCFSKEC